MEEEGVIVMETALERVLLDDFLLKFLDGFHFILVGTSAFQLTSALVRIIVDLQNLIHVVTVAVFRALFPTSATAKNLVLVILGWLSSYLHEADHSHTS